MKKVLLINTKYKIFSGEDSNIAEEIDFLNNKYEVSYLEFNNSDRLDIFDFFSFIFTTNLKSNKIILNKIKTFKPDLVYIHNTWFKAGTGIFKKIISLNIPIFLKLHNFRYDCSKSIFAKNHVSKGKSCPKCGFINKKYSFFNRYYDESMLKSILLIIYGKKYIKVLRDLNIKILVLTKFHKKFLEKNGIYSEKIEVSYNPMNFHNTVKSYNPKSNYVVYPGRITKSKGVIELIELWEKINPKLILKIIGTGDLYWQLKNKYKNNSNIEFYGQLNNEDVLEQIKNSRAVITCTKMFEGQPRILCEASSLRIPSIFPSFGGMREFFPENYPLAFEQFDNKSLEEKINLLENSNLLTEISDLVYQHINNLLNKDKMLDNFQLIESKFLK